MEMRHKIVYGRLGFISYRISFLKSYSRTPDGEAFNLKHLSALDNFGGLLPFPHGPALTPAAENKTSKSRLFFLSYPRVTKRDANKDYIKNTDE
ncbi:hypothetical protein HF086_017956 [Spodoptera exigua]|uniref:Uncharacterized protein n=1 Tax=Spodoptera exigua TaxID=7107 RepID=A0A922M0Z9_SPOEX|nr:hypothetical protein HF086_017956 [Spodoptera exigua]